MKRMKGKLITRCAMACAVSLLVSCGSDDERWMPDAQNVIYDGQVKAEVDYNGTGYDCGAFDATTVIDVDTKGNATITICPMTFDINVPMMGSMRIATAEDLIITGLVVTRDDDAIIYKGVFGQQIKTVMHGAETPLPISGTIDATQKSGALSFNLDILEWGSMPFGLELDFTGAGAQ